MSFLLNQAWINLGPVHLVPHWSLPRSSWHSGFHLEWILFSRARSLLKRITYKFRLKKCRVIIFASKQEETILQSRLRRLRVNFKHVLFFTTIQIKKLRCIYFWWVTFLRYLPVRPTTFRFLVMQFLRANIHTPCNSINNHFF